MKRSERNILQHLANNPLIWELQSRLPNGNGHIGNGASGAVLRDLRDAGLIEYGSPGWPGSFGWCITEAGRLELMDAKK